MKAKKISPLITLFVFTLALFALSFITTKSAKAYVNESDDTITVTPSISGENLVLTANDSQVISDGFQFWLKKSVDLVDSVEQDHSFNIWMMVSNGYIPRNTSVSVNESDFNIDGYYYLLVKSKTPGGVISQKMFNIERSGLTATIKNVTINQKNITEVNYLETGSAANIRVGSGDFTLIDKDGSTYQSSDSLLSYTPHEGLYTVRLVPVGGLETDSIIVKISGYNVLDDYTKIKSVKLNDINNFTEKTAFGLSETLFIETQAIGLPSEPTATITIGGTAPREIPLNQNYTLNLEDFGLATISSGYGVYTFRLEIKADGYVQDYFEGYYYYARAGIGAKVNVGVTKGDGNEYFINASGVENIDGSLQYKYIKWAFNGEYAITDWIDESTHKVNIINDGTYAFEVRVRGLNAGSYEVRTISQDVVKGDLGNGSEAEKSIVITNSNGNAAAIVSPNNVYKVSVDEYDDTVMYKFIVYSYGQWKVKEYYSPNNSFIWIPNKTGEYMIETRILNNGSYGWRDYCAQPLFVEVTDSDYLNIELNDNWIYQANNIEGVKIPSGYTVTKDGQDFSLIDGIVPLSDVGVYVVTDGHDSFTFSVYDTEDFAKIIAPLSSTQQDGEFEVSGTVMSTFVFDSSEQAYYYSSSGNYVNSSVKFVKGSVAHTKLTEGISQYTYFAVDIKYKDLSKKTSFISFFLNGINSTNISGVDAVIIDSNGTTTAYANMLVNEWYTAYLPAIVGHSIPYFTTGAAGEMYIKNFRFTNHLEFELYNDGVYEKNSASGIKIVEGYTVTKGGQPYALSDGWMILSEVGNYVATNDTETINFKVVDGKTISRLNSSTDETLFSLRGTKAPIFAYDQGMNAYKLTVLDGSAWGTSEIIFTGRLEKSLDAVSAGYGYFTFDVYYTDRIINFAHMLRGAASQNMQNNATIRNYDGDIVLFANLTFNEWYTVYIPISGNANPYTKFSPGANAVGTIAYLKNMRLQSTAE